MAEVVWPLRVLLEKLMEGAKHRTKRIAANRAIAEADRTDEQARAWDDARDLVAHAVTLSHPRAGYTVLIFPDASDKHWGSFLTQVPQDELDRG